MANQQTKQAAISGMSSPIPDIADILRVIEFSPQQGKIAIDKEKFLLFRVELIRELRQMLFNRLGLAEARNMLLHMGYVLGYKDAALARRLRVNHPPEVMFMLGPQIHSLTGHVVVQPERIEFNPEHGHFYGEFTWLDSAEAKVHMEIFGKGAEAACWMQLGYASGYCSGLMGKTIFFQETHCQAMGDDHCRIIGKPREDWRVLPRHYEFLGESSDASLPQSDGSKDVSKKDALILIGVSTAFNTALKMVDKAAPTEVGILLEGETGVGKEKFARLIHQKSRRTDGPFVAFNCAAIPESLLEAELFGVEKGAYTGASQSRSGKFERASGGTIFLDEISTLSLAAQSKLLRVLQEGELERLGDSKIRKVDVRVIAATNINLYELVEKGEFREDLYFRLNVFPILLPPLRSRLEDLPLFLNYFLKKFCQRHHKTITGFTAEALKALSAYHYPGNIRELEHIIERAVIVAEDQGSIDTQHLRFERLKKHFSPSSADKNDHQEQDWGKLWLNNPQSLAAIEKRLIETALSQSQGNLTKASRLLGISRAQLAYRIGKVG